MCELRMGGVSIISGTLKECVGSLSDLKIHITILCCTIIIICIYFFVKYIYRNIVYVNGFKRPFFILSFNLLSVIECNVATYK